MTHYSSYTHGPRRHGDTEAHFWFLCVYAMTLSLVIGAPASAQTYTPPKTADGHPDIQGIWQVVNTAA